MKNVKMYFIHSQIFGDIYRYQTFIQTEERKLRQRDSNYFRTNNLTQLSEGEEIMYLTIDFNNGLFSPYMHMKKSQWKTL